MPAIAAVAITNATITGVATPLQVKQATVALDEGWAPYCQADLVCVLPAAADVELMDPRQALRLKFTLTASFEPWDGSTSNTAPVTRTFDLALRSRSVEFAAGELTVSAASDEALAQDSARTIPSIYRPATTSARVAINAALATIGAALQAGTADATGLDTDSTAWPPGLSVWDYSLPLAQAGDLRLYCDEQRRWWLVPSGDLGAGFLDVDYTNNTVQVSEELNREDEWFDGVAITYTWTDVNGVAKTAWDTAPADNSAKRVLAVAFSTAKPKAGAAASMLSRAKGRALRSSATVVVDFTATPTMPVQISNPNSTPVRSGVVAAVRFVIPDDEMTIATRELTTTPANSWVSIPAGKRWSDIPAGVPWSGAWTT